MIFAKENVEGPLLSYSGARAIAPEEFLRLSEQEAVEEMRKAQQLTDPVYVAFKEKADADLDGAFNALTTGIELTAEQAKALGARPKKAEAEAKAKTDSG